MILCMVAETRCGDSCVCVTGLDIWGFEVVEALLLCALSGKEGAHSEQWHCS